MRNQRWFWTTVSALHFSSVEPRILILIVIQFSTTISFVFLIPIIALIQFSCRNFISNIVISVQGIIISVSISVQFSVNIQFLLQHYMSTGDGQPISKLNNEYSTVTNPVKSEDVDLCKSFSWNITVKQFSFRKNFCLFLISFFFVHFLLLFSFHFQNKSYFSFLFQWRELHHFHSSYYPHMPTGMLGYIVYCFFLCFFVCLSAKFCNEYLWRGLT